MIAIGIEEDAIVFHMQDTKGNPIGTSRYSAEVAEAMAISILMYTDILQKSNEVPE